MFEAGRADLEFPEGPGLSKPIVVETDGGMVPIVEPGRDEKDKRKGKNLSWREAKLSLAHAQGSRTPVYAGSIEGGAEAAGGNCWPARFAPASGRTRGSTRSATGAMDWGEVEEQFGDQGDPDRFLSCLRYLSAAAEAIAPDAAARETWIEAQKDALRDGRLEMTLRSLVGHCEAPEVDENKRRCADAIVI